MKIVIVGRCAPIGWKLVNLLRRRGHNALLASPVSGVDTVTGEGLAKVLTGAEIVVDVASSRSFEDQAALQFFTASTRNLLAAEVAAGIQHHVALSAVGSDRLLEGGQFRGRMAQEGLIRTSNVPYSIVRSTQFADFTCAIAHSATRGQTVRLPSATIQPILSDDVTEVLAEIALDAPLNAMAEVGGPERFQLDEFVRRFLAVVGDTRQVMTDPGARYFGARLNDHSLLPAEGARIGATRFDDWIKCVAFKRQLSNPAVAPPTIFVNRSLSPGERPPMPGN